MFDIYLALTPW